MAVSEVLDEAAFSRAFDSTFSYVAFVLNRHLVNHMLRSSRELGVDYESLIIWGLLAHQNVAHLVPAGGALVPRLSPRGRLSETAAELRPMLLRDLAQITGIPRETVRRKLIELSERGYTRRLPGKGWIIAHQSIEPGLREFTRESVRQMLQCARQIQGALDGALDRHSEELPAQAPGAATDAQGRG